MPDANLEWKTDLTLTPNGDWALSDGDTLTQQRIQRRLFTAVKGYIWHLDYGAGLPQRIGKPARVVAIRALIRAQIALEATVAPTPLPTVTVTEPASNPGLFFIAVNYTDAITGRATALKFEVPSSS